jgi:HIT domain
VAECPFCAIVAGRLPSSQVYADDTVLAFLDIRPASTGHLLVVPRTHSGSLGDLPERTGSAMFATAQRLAKALRASGLRCDGINFSWPTARTPARRWTTSTCTCCRASPRTASRSAPALCHQTGPRSTRRPPA